MSLKGFVREIISYLKKDTWDSWLVSMALIVICIKFVLFPLLSFITGTPLPLVVVESCSMYHASPFAKWWQQNSQWYERHNVSYSEFKEFGFLQGLNKGDIVLVWGRDAYAQGDVIIFTAATKYPIIHRIISEKPLSTKGDHNSDQLPLEKDIPKEAILGKAVGKIPLLGWVKLIFFEPFKSQDTRGPCKV